VCQSHNFCGGLRYPKLRGGANVGLQGLAIVSSTSRRGVAVLGLWASCSHPYASVTEQYNLLPVNKR